MVWLQGILPLDNSYAYGQPPNSEAKLVLSFTNFLIDSRQTISPEKSISLLVLTSEACQKIFFDPLLHALPRKPRAVRLTPALNPYCSIRLHRRAARQ